MKSRKYKRSQHFIKSVYERGYGIRPPYQVLVDEQMCLASYRHKFDLFQRLAKVLGGPVKPMVTTCVMTALRESLHASATLGKEQDKEKRFARGAYAVGRNLELRRCRHKIQNDENEDPVSISECFKQLVGQRNVHHYGVVTNNDELKRYLRTIPGVPIIYLERTFPLLEAPTKLTLGKARLQEQEKLKKISQIEENLVQREFGEVSTAKNPEKIHRHRKAKGPNPLSVKKPKRIESSAMTLDEGRHRKRRHRRTTKTSVTGTSHTNKLENK